MVDTGHSERCCQQWITIKQTFVNAWKTRKNYGQQDISKQYDQPISFRNSPLERKGKNWTNKLVDLMKCFHTPERKTYFAGCTVQQLSKTYRPSRSYGLMLDSTYFRSLMFALSVKSFKSALHDIVGKSYGNFRTIKVATVIRCIQQDRFWRLIFEKAIGELTIQCQNRQLNADSHLIEGERQPTVTLSTVVIKKMWRTSWCLDSKIKPYHITTAGRRLEKHPFLNRKESKKGSVFWSAAAPEWGPIVHLESQQVLSLRRYTAA